MAKKTNRKKKRFHGIKNTIVADLFIFIPGGCFFPQLAGLGLWGLVTARGCSRDS